MKLAIFQLALFLVFSGIANAEINLHKESEIVFASVKEGRKILGNSDEFVRQMSPFDRAARMKTNRTVSEKRYLAFVQNNVLKWNHEEKRQVLTSLQVILPEVKRFSVQFPANIYLVKTTGQEEGNAAYTRTNAIIIPQTELEKSQFNLQKILAHELFHIITRNNPAYREKLYNLIGFQLCEEIDLPNVLKPYKITNPDAPLNNHFIEVMIQGRKIPVIPILLAKSRQYDPQTGGEFFDYLIFQLLVIKKDEGGKHFIPMHSGPNPVLVGLKQVGGYFEQVGRNTDYIIHPEEILADNFALLITKQKNPTSPRILKKMSDILQAKT